MQLPKSRFAWFCSACCALLSLLFASSVRAEEQRKEEIAKLPPRAELKILLEALRDKAQAPGAVLGLSFGGGRAEVLASGLADREEGRPMTEENANHLASISKTYTAALILRLVEEGRFGLDDKLARFLPAFPRADEITLRHLLAHRSGLKDFYLHLYFRPDRDEMIRMVTKDWKEEELIELAGRFGHWSEPGAEASYCNANYYLLAIVAERATGKKLAELYRQYIEEPLGLEKTWLAWHEKAKGQLATGYMGYVEYWKHSEMFGELGSTAILDRSPVDYGSGGLIATAEESLKFLHALLGKKLLTEKSLAAMMPYQEIAPLGVHQEGASEKQRYGLGLLERKRGKYTFVGHGGLFTGHTAGLWQVPECNLEIALYFNRGFVDQGAVLDLLMAGLDVDGKLCGGSSSP